MKRSKRLIFALVLSLILGMTGILTAMPSFAEEEAQPTTTAESSDGQDAAASGDEVTAGADETNVGDPAEPSKPAGTGETAPKADEQETKETSADQAVARIGDTTYASLQQALDAAADGDTIVLLADTKESTTVTGKKLVIDFDGKTLTAAGEEPALSARGGELTLKNGTVTGGKAFRGGAITTWEVAETTMEKMTITGNEEVAVMIAHHVDINGSGPDVPCHATIKDCHFTKNGKVLTGDDARDREQYALMLYRVSADATGTTFDYNQDSLWYVHNFKNPSWMNRLQFNLKDSVFKYNNGVALACDCPYKNDISVSNCQFLYNKSGEKDQIIHLKEVEYAFNGKAETDFYYCTISRNEAKKYTILTESGVSKFRSCRISYNKAGEVGAIQGYGYVDLQLGNSAINNNHSYATTARGNSGGVSVQALTSVNHAADGAASSGGYSRAWLTMTAGALYNNTMDIPDGYCDLYVNDTGILDKVTDAKDMKDGNYDFSNKEWSHVNYGTVQDVGKKIYIDPKGGDDENKGARKNPVKTLKQAIALMEKNQATCIVVMNTIPIGTAEGTVKMSAADEEYTSFDLGGQCMERDKDFKGALLAVNSGKLIVKNAVIDGLFYEADEALITVASGAKLELGEGAVLQHNGHYKPGDTRTYHFSELGGGVYAEGDVLMQEGASILYNAATTGGGICMKNGTLTMTGGLISGNKAKDSVFDSLKGQLGEQAQPPKDDCYGGGVALAKGGKMEFSGGTIDGNEADRGGGGIAVGADYFSGDLNGEETLSMTGGIVSNNTAFAAGGGIFVQCLTKATITAGDITGNKALAVSGAAYHAGGGIYVNGFHGKEGLPNGILIIDNVELGHNEAEGEGSAIAYCGSGSGAISDIKGTAIHDNNAKGKVDSADLGDASEQLSYTTEDVDILLDNVAWTFDQNKDREDNPWSWEIVKERANPVTLPAKMLGGASYQWTDENGQAIADEDLVNMKTMQRFKTAATETSEDVKKAIEMSTVHINGNYSRSNGGGIGANGDLRIGEPPTDEIPPDEEVEVPPESEEETPEVKSEYTPPTRKSVAPRATKTVKSVGTGDAISMALMLALFALAAAMILFAKKRETEA